MIFLKKNIILTFILLAFSLFSCKENNRNYNQKSPVTEPATSFVQEKEHFLSDITDKYTPLNYQNQIGMWISYIDYEEIMADKSETEFREAIQRRFKEAEKQSVNTVYVHVRPCGDAYYSSSFFPKGESLDGNYDPLSIMIEEGHSIGLSVHAWINPLRCQTTEEIKSVPDNYIIKQWYESEMGRFVNTVNDRIYLNPAYDEVIQLICKDTDEIVRNYNVDGIHIDDYFYPTTNESFDKTAFEKSGHRDLSQWRLENCNRLVHSVFESIKRVDSRILFGISPQGNINANYKTQYADVKHWGATIGYCDYIVPQIYFGFENETCPFAETLKAWEKIVSAEHISLIIGLAAYKQGNMDKWAGASGENEWIDNPDLIKQQIEYVNKSSADGYALYY